MNIYESDKLVNEYLLFHYGSDEEVLPHPGGPREALGFAVRTVTEMLEQAPEGRALDLGCSVGRSSFELSRTCDEVIGIDFSEAFIAAAEKLRTEGEADYIRLEEGLITTAVSARRPEGSRPGNVQFEVGDAMDLRGDIGLFDIVHAANLICRLPDPKVLLSRFGELVKPGGSLVLTTPCTWLGEFTQPWNWPDKPTIEWLEDHLSPAFALEVAKDVPFLIRETARKFQWTVAQGSRWRRK